MPTPAIPELVVLELFVLVLETVPELELVPVPVPELVPELVPEPEPEELPDVIPVLVLLLLLMAEFVDPLMQPPVLELLLVEAEPLPVAKLEAVEELMLVAALLLVDEPEAGVDPLLADELPLVPLSPALLAS